MNGFHQSYYTQAVGNDELPPSSAAMQQHFAYPNASGPAQYSGYGALTSHDMYPYGQDQGLPPPQQDVYLPPTDPPPVPDQPPPATGEGTAQSGAFGISTTTWGFIGWTLAAAGAATGVYHGYKRNKSAGWALGWGLFGLMLPIVSIPLSIAQGYGKRKAGR